MYSLWGIHSHIPLRAPHTHSHTLVGLTTTGNRKKKSEQHVTTRSVNKNAIKPNLTLVKKNTSIFINRQHLCVIVEMDKDLLVGVCHETRVNEGNNSFLFTISMWLHPLAEPLWWSLTTSHLVGLIEETAASSQLEEAQVLVYAAARELPGQIVTYWHTKKNNTEITGRIYKKVLHRQKVRKIW